MQCPASGRVHSKATAADNGGIRARQSAPMAVLRLCGYAVKQNAASPKNCPAALRRDFFDKLKRIPRDPFFCCTA